MFIELHNPKVIDRNSTRDRVKLRIGEETSSGRFWLTLSFDHQEDAITFLKDAIIKLEAPWPAE